MNVKVKLEQNLRFKSFEKLKVDSLDMKNFSDISVVLFILRSDKKAGNTNCFCVLNKVVVNHTVEEINTNMKSLMIHLAIIVDADKLVNLKGSVNITNLLLNPSTIPICPR